MIAQTWHQMNHFDQTLLAILVLFTLWGLVRGMFTASLSLLFCVVSFAISILFLSKLAAYLSSFAIQAYTANITAFFILLFLSLLIGALLNMIFSALFAQLGKGVMGRLLGGGVGFVHGIFTSVIIAFVIFNSPMQHSKWYEKSISYSVLDSWASFIQDHYATVKDWHTVDEKPAAITSHPAA